jgi:hypothetical protein
MFGLELPTLSDLEAPDAAVINEKMHQGAAFLLDGSMRNQLLMGNCYIPTRNH